MARTNPTPCFVPSKGELIPHPGRQIKHATVTTECLLHLPPFAINPPVPPKKGTRFLRGSPELLMGKISFPVARGRWSALEQGREQNDDGAISIIDLARACVISIDLYGVCEETDKRLAACKVSVAALGHGAEELKPSCDSVTAPPKHTKGKVHPRCAARKKTEHFKEKHQSVQRHYWTNQPTPPPAWC